MIPKGLFTQIGMLVGSVAIVLTYVKPTFTGIGILQDDIASYRRERENVVYVNSQLSSYLTKLESISAEEQRRLLVYLPDQVDSITVQRDLQGLVDLSGALYKSVSYEKESDDTSTSVGVVSTLAAPIDPMVSAQETYQVPKPDEDSFKLSLSGTYQQIKELCRLLENNDYPLEVRELDITKGSGDLLEADFRIVVYGYHNPTEDLSEGVSGNGVQF